MLDQTTVMNLSRKYASEVERVLNPQAVVLFGSHAKGTAHANSDIDIAVILNDFTGDYLEMSKQLYKLRRHISADIEPVLLDASRDDSGFVGEIMRTGHVLSAQSA